MTSYTFDNQSLFKDGKRWFPVMGEMHYSRVPQAEWKEELLKMKEGGVDIVSSYVIWIHHEETENDFDWKGQRNLRAFVEEIGKAGLSMVLRIGPWSHAEARNGGFPDWLINKCPEYRSNNEAYFSEVEKFFKEIFRQVEGLFLKDGGPIIGIQVENEFGHCGGLQGTEGEYHMNRLTNMAKEIGFDVPLWTATGWGGAVTGGLLPVMGGYCDAPWDLRPAEIEPSGNYVFSYERNDHAIGSDFGLGEGITFDMTKFPYLTAELGGGLQVTYRRRPVAMAGDIGGMTLTKMGSGCNLLGYYMYHGGQNPDAKVTTLEENQSTGYINDLPVRNYDFRAPLGQYGYTNGTYDEIKLFSMFVHDFGESFCATKAFIPDENPLQPDNAKDLRTSWRWNENDISETGYVFVNNYVRHQKMAEHNKVALAAFVRGTDGRKEKIVFPETDIKNGEYFFLPFNMKVGKNHLKTAMVSPLCVLNNKTYVFYSDKVLNASCVSAEKADKDLFQFESVSDTSVEVMTLPKSIALKAHKITDSKGQEKLIVSDDTVFVDGNELVSDKVIADGNLDVRFVGEEGSTKKFAVTVPAFDTEDAFLEVYYRGNCARLYKADAERNGPEKGLVDDSIYMGKDFPWVIGLKRYGKHEKEFIFEVDALGKEDKVYLEEEIPETLCELTEIKFYKIERRREAL